MRRWQLALALPAVLALALATAACGGGGGGSSGTTTQPAATGAPQTGSAQTGATAAGGGSTQAASYVPIKLGFSTWNGYAGLVIGVKSGIFEKNGLDVTYNVIEDPPQRFNALKAGSINAIATTPDTFSREAAVGIPTVMVVGLDASVGGDGIVAKKDITSVKQLAGQQVAVSQGSTSQWMLAYVLQQNGMSLKDVKQVNMTSGDAGAAFAAGRVPIAVTWQPWLDKTKQNPDGHVLVSTVKYPTIITDSVAFDPSFVQENPDTVKQFVKAYGQVLDLIKSNPDEAFKYATDYLGQSVEDIKATEKYVPLWTLQQSAKYFGTTDNPGPVYDIYNKSATFWKSIGEIKTLPDAKEAVNSTFLDEVLGGQ